MRTWMTAAVLAGLAMPAAAQEERRRDDGKEPQPQKRKSQEQAPGAELHAAWYDNWMTGVHFRLDPRGRVFLMVPDEDRKGEFRTYQAESMQAFRREHAELVRRHDLETLFGMSERGDGRQDPSGRRFQDTEEFRRWVQEQAQALRSNLGEWRQEGREDRGDKEEPADRGGRSLGIVVAPIDPAMQAQLRLEEGQGFVIHNVQEGSLAEKAGLRKHDVIAELKGRGVYEFQEFRSSLEDLLSKDQAFELGIIRTGERRTVKIQPGPEGKEAK